MGIKNYKDAFIIITGAGSGIGRELLGLLYSSTQNILTVDFNQEFLEKLKADFPLIHTVKADLSQKEGNQLVLDWVKSHWSRVDYCFANAGKAEYGAAHDQDWGNAEQLFHLNFHSPIQIGLTLKALYAESKFRLIITASAMSFWTVPGYSLCSNEVCIASMGKNGLVRKIRKLADIGISDRHPYQIFRNCR